MMYRIRHKSSCKGFKQLYVTFVHCTLLSDIERYNNLPIDLGVIYMYGTTYIISEHVHVYMATSMLPGSSEIHV